ncbi:hypothetical protein [Fischerella thermalis]|uniref:hypothetical protein n=1 Tax=Fischerella thermalis TaxID=372787 RepID=UPI00307F0305
MGIRDQGQGRHGRQGGDGRKPTQLPITHYPLPITQILNKRLNFLHVEYFIAKSIV